MTGGIKKLDVNAVTLINRSSELIVDSIKIKLKFHFEITDCTKIWFMSSYFKFLLAYIKLIQRDFNSRIKVNAAGGV